MASNQLYILPEDVQMLPVKALPEQALAKFEYEADDFIITYAHARNTSKIIDASSASLLQEFRKPKSLPEGVLTYALLNNLDAQTILESSYNVLSRLRNEGFLISYDNSSGKNKAYLKAGDRFKDYEIISKLDGVADTEIYKIRKDGQFTRLNC